MTSNTEASRHCPRCGETKPDWAFYKDKRGKLSTDCRVCKIAYAKVKKRQYRSEGRYTEQEATYKRTYFARKWQDPAFRQRELARKRQWYAANKERARA